MVDLNWHDGMTWGSYTKFSIKWLIWTGMMAWLGEVNQNFPKMANLNWNENMTAWRGEVGSFNKFSRKTVDLVWNDGMKWGSYAIFPSLIKMVGLNWNDGMTWQSFLCKISLKWLIWTGMMAWLDKTYPKVVDLNWNDGMICGKCEKKFSKNGRFEIEWEHDWYDLG